MLLRNPYTNRNRILTEADFFGREKELRSVFTRLLGGASVLLVGERRTGKSSILSALSFESERDSMGIPPNLRIAYTDCQEVPGCNEDQFLDYLCGSFALAMDLPVPEPADRAAFKRLGIQARSQAGLQPVLAIDEFDVLLENEKVGPALLAFLRSWSSGAQVPIVLASWEGSIDELAKRPSLGSAFLNIFAWIYVGALAPEDAMELIVTPAQAISEPFAPDEIEWIRRFGGLHPFFLQMAASHLLDARRGGATGQMAMMAAEKNFVYDAAPHLQFLVSRLTPSERTALAAWFHGQTNISLGDGYEGLFRKGILINDPKPRVFSEAFSHVFQRAETAT